MKFVDLGKVKHFGSKKKKKKLKRKMCFWEAPNAHSIIVVIFYKANERFYEINHHRILISNWILEVRFFFYVKSKFYSLFSFILITYKNNSLNATKIILSFFSKFLFSPKNCVLITSISPCNWWTSNHAIVWVLVN